MLVGQVKKFDAEKDGGAKTCASRSAQRSAANQPARVRGRWTPHFYADPRNRIIIDPNSEGNIDIYMGNKVRIEFVPPAIRICNVRTQTVRIQTSQFLAHLENWFHFTSKPAELPIA